ncbi:MAG: hypothetical protein CMO26_04610 [Thiotrichales bacterium]|nr:hypothetical protein [Thiotrichales bacterium]
MSETGHQSSHEIRAPHCEQADCKITVLEPYGIRLLPGWWSEQGVMVRCERCAKAWRDESSSGTLGF